MNFESPRPNFKIEKPKGYNLSLTPAQKNQARPTSTRKICSKLSQKPL
jgi:hypothetical protein